MLQMHVSVLVARTKPERVKLTMNTVHTARVDFVTNFFQYLNFVLIHGLLLTWAVFCVASHPYTLTVIQIANTDLTYLVQV